MKFLTKLSTMEMMKNLKTNDSNCVYIEGELLKKYQRVVLSIAEDVIKVCEDENIFYQLSGGTALGAVRHNGFIPWDDDIDINLLGTQQEKFWSSFKKKFGNKYWIHNYNTPEYGLQMGKILLKDSILREHLNSNSSECGISIDVFFIENVPDNFIVRKLHGIVCMIFGGILSCRIYYQNRKSLIEITKNNEDVLKAVRKKILIGRIWGFVSVRSLAKSTHRIYTLCKNNNSKFVSIPGGRKHYFGEMYLRDGMIHTVKKRFEGHNWQIAKDYDSYFKALYGSNYMIPPAEENREKHIVMELKLPEE